MSRGANYTLKGVLVLAKATPEITGSSPTSRHYGSVAYALRSQKLISAAKRGLWAPAVSLEAKSVDLRKGGSYMVGEGREAAHPKGVWEHARPEKF